MTEEHDRALRSGMHECASDCMTPDTRTPDKAASDMTWRERLRFERAVKHPWISHTWIQCPGCVGFAVACAHCGTHKSRGGQMFHDARLPSEEARP